MDLVLGTVQFGLAYGVAGADSPVAEPEVEVILARAWEGGIAALDTAPGYGTIEERLPALVGPTRFAVWSKIPGAPKDLGDADAAAWCVASAERSRARLGDRLSVLAFHDADDLAGGRGRAIVDAVAHWSERAGVRIGASTYAPDACVDLHDRLGLDHFQTPANALDQRLAALPAHVADLDIHIRSAFLQGLLLMPREAACRRVPAAASALVRWESWCAENALAPLAAALALARGFRSATGTIVGVDSANQVDAVLEAWNAAAPMSDPGLAVDDPDVIDPRRWANA